MADDLAAIRSKLRAPEDELYLEIGRELLGRSALQQAPAQLIAAAKRWIAAKNDAIRTAVCGSELAKALMHSDPSAEETLTLISALADLLSSIVVGVSSGTVAVLLVRQGIKRVCSGIT